MDFSTAVVDPVDDRTVHYIGEYATNTANGAKPGIVDGYRTRVGVLSP